MLNGNISTPSTPIRTIQLDRMFAPPHKTASNHIKAKVDTFEPSQEIASEPINERQLVSIWDVPGIITFSWIRSTAEALKSRGDYVGPFQRAVGGLMVLASPIVIPASLFVDAVNTVLFPAKILYRSL